MSWLRLPSSMGRALAARPIYECRSEAFESNVRRGFLASTAGAGILAVRRGGAERENACRGKDRTPRDSIHELIEYTASHVPHLNADAFSSRSQSDVTFIDGQRA